MSRKNVFLYDIDVPEIVQKKAEEAFSMIKAEGETMVKKESTKQKYSAKKEERRPVKNNRPKKQSRAKKRQMAGILSGSRYNHRSERNMGKPGSGYGKEWYGNGKHS